jgi:Domain of unknown function (DUF5916)
VKANRLTFDILIGFGWGVCLATAAAAAEPTPARLQITRIHAPITVDGDLSDEGWQGVPGIETWFEVNPGDNVAPKVRSVGYLAYDEKALYAGFEFDDPEPRRIRAPFADRDNVSNDTDYGGIILDPRHDGKTGILLLANARGIQYDSVNDDASGGNEDSSPDFFWASAARITKKGWTLEIRVPFSSLRYPPGDPQTWGVMLYRNYPREYRYQMFTTRLPRGGSCFICRENPLVGLKGLPSGGHVTVAPYASAAKSATPPDDVLGAPLEGRPLDSSFGVDAKWTPGAATAVDLTANPDFSQIESDVAQIGANERFALFYPEKRPFFLEGNELFSTPIRAVYTRTITSPEWGSRVTGKAEGTAYTFLVSHDRGGGQVVLPGSNSSDLADQDFKSTVAVARMRYDIGRSFVSFLGTTREIDGGGHNRVYGPDAQWRPNDKETLTVQLLFTDTVTPNRTDLAETWDGRTLKGRGISGWWLHSTRRVDGFTEYRDFTSGFRADDGFVPQAAFRESDGEYGYTFRPSGILTRLRTFTGYDYQEDRGSAVLLRQFYAGFGFDGRWGSQGRFRFFTDHVRAGDVLVPRHQMVYDLVVSPARFVSNIKLQGWVGQEADFDNFRPGHGANVSLSGSVRATDHIEVQLLGAKRWLNVATPSMPRERLFTADVERVRATYTFSSRLFLRLIGQWARTLRDTALYADQVDHKDGDFGGSALLAYKLNWQTVMFVGFGDSREFDATGMLQKKDRQFFAKLSYAFQR